MMKSSVQPRKAAPISGESTAVATAVKGKNLVLCCDGTGIGEDHNAGEIVTPSNIVRIFNCVDSTAPLEGERHQIAFYERGVGSVGNVLTKAGQGMTGYGIGTKIKILYHWLGVNWNEYKDQEEDRLFLFGFSRGAFAIRSLMGMLYGVGLLPGTRRAKAVGTLTEEIRRVITVG